MTTISEFVKRCTDKDVLVIGDFVLDEYIDVEFFQDLEAEPFGLECVWQKQVDSIGAAGIVARQCKEICSHVDCIGLVGTDMIGRALTADFKRQQIHLVNLTHLLEEREDVASPFRERLRRGPDRQVLKLMRCGYSGERVPKLLEYSDLLSNCLHDLPRLPDIVFLCDYDQGLFTQNVVYQLAHSVALRNKMMVLKARQWKDVYQRLPIELLLLDADPSWLGDEDFPRILERDVSHLAREFDHPLFVICNLRHRGCGVYEFRSPLPGGRNVLCQAEYLPKSMQQVGLFSAVAALTGLLCYTGRSGKASFVDDAVALIAAIVRARVPWEYAVASLDTMRKWRLPGSAKTKIKAGRGDAPEGAGRAIRILFLAANPTDVGSLRLGVEIREIDKILRQTDYGHSFEIEQQHAVQISDLQGHLLRYKPDIVHFSGHGSARGEIILEDGCGRSQPVPVRALSELFSILKENIRCVVLNACYTEEQAHAIAEHIDCVIGMPRAIEDAAVISFAMAFYQALGFGKDVKTAFDLGRSQIDLVHLAEQDMPRLLTVKGDATQIAFGPND
jgi:hypothetical protein